ncbi:undecaprenyl-diphosphatase [Paenibacillus castaneae]|uniref:phosphatase PAP2 family protein n=1 Tax=Paenibacillus castaneae TaxID=474957 RepID=UPI001FD5548F|nr:phosphatase PAP2 family protein [Paenibacillus castaneae]NIK76793.1 undecaprenyl-diphosphatase [Paenibacillus castaneae]
MKWLFTRTFVLSVICAAGFASIAILIAKQAISGFDNKIISIVQSQQSDALTQIMLFFSYIGSGIPLSIIIIAIGIVLYAVLKFHWELLFFIGVIIGSSLLNVILKLIFHRERPTLHRIVENVSGYSFPSGHSMAAFTLYGVLCFLLWKHAESTFSRILLVSCTSVMILAIGISRIYLGVHYPSDVVGAYLGSGTWLAVSIGFYQHFIAKRVSKG